MHLGRYDMRRAQQAPENLLFACTVVYIAAEKDGGLSVSQQDVFFGRISRFFLRDWLVCKRLVYVSLISICSVGKWNCDGNSARHNLVYES